MSLPESNRSRIWKERLHHCHQRVGEDRGLVVEGKITRMIGLTLEAVGCRAAIGGQCDVISSSGERIESEVVGFAGESLYLMPTGDIRGLEQDARVVPTGRVCEAVVGDHLLGRVLDGAGRPLDGKGRLHGVERRPLTGKVFNPLSRTPIRKPLDVGVRAINALLSVGRGQRLGLFAGSGVGKSVLLGMMTRFTNAEVIVVGLIGERGREVKEFIEEILGPQGMSKCVVVAAPADVSPVLRLRGAEMATSIAEYFRDQGKQVLLLMDSLTRFAQAQREVSLATGELPASKGYTPSVFTRMNQLIERTGNGVRGAGSVTAFYTVLSEGEYQADPIADAARAILDGHIVLSREYADAGHYPAIDIEKSISRVRTAITDTAHQRLVQAFRKSFATYRQNADLIRVGAYTRGSDPELDLAVDQYPKLMAFLTQDINESVSFEQALGQLQVLLSTAET